MGFLEGLPPFLRTFKLALNKVISPLYPLEV